MSSCTCTRAGHTHRSRRRGFGRCMRPGCPCLWAPTVSPRQLADPPARGRATVDENGLVVRFEPPVEHKARLSDREKLERLLWQRIDWTGLPLPVLQYRWALSEGRQYRSDGAYVETRVLLEVQGGIWAANPGRHNRGSGYEKDLERSNLAALTGWKLLAFSERMIKSGEAVKTIARALGRELAGDVSQTSFVGVTAESNGG